MSRQPTQHFGEHPVDQQARLATEAHRRACVHDAEPDAPVTGIMPLSANDGEPYSSEEHAEALPTPHASLNWAGGDIKMDPCLQGAASVSFDTPVANGRGEALFGVESVALGHNVGR